MSRAVLKMALSRTIHREPTQDELNEFLSALADLSSGDRVYIPRPSPVTGDAIRLMRSQGASIRAIARMLGCSKSHVGRELRQLDMLGVPNSALFVDKKVD